jgi:hypothetical protein
MKDTNMLDSHPTFATLTIVTHPPTPKPRQHGVIIGFGLLKVTKLTNTSFEFSALTGVADTLDDEAQLLTELADALPHPTFVFGQNIDASTFAPLERAANLQPRLVAAHLKQRLARFQAAIQVDTAQPAGPRSPPPYREAMRATPAVVIEVAGNAIVDVEAAYDDLERLVIDSWRRFDRRTTIKPRCVPMA